MARKTQKFDLRQQMNRNNFEVFHYRDEKPKPVKIHHHDFYEIYFFLGGDVSYLVDGKNYKLNRGDLLLISPQELHRPIVKAGSVYERIVLWIDRTYLASLSTPECDLTLCFQSDKHNHTNVIHTNAMMRGRIAELFELLCREAYSTDFAAEAYAQGLLLQLLAEVNRLVQQRDEPVSSSEAPSLVNRITSYINTHYGEDISLDTLSAHFFVSKYYLSHEFSQKIGISVVRYLTLKRLSIAKELLSEGLSASEVCAHCGFHNYTTFYRTFREEYGISPGRAIERAK